MSIALFVNARARAHRRNPRLLDDLRQALGHGGRVHVPADLAALDAEAALLARAPPALIAIHGGDGTLHKTLTALLRAFGPAPLPPLALLAGGTMNAVVTSLGLRAPPVAFVRALADEHRTGRPPRSIPRRCLTVGGAHGFIFGTGFITQFLEAYYAGADPGPLRAVWLIARCIASAIVRGPFARRIFAPFRGRVLVDGRALERRVLTGVSASTVREIGLHLRLNHRAGEDPERLAALAIHGGVLGLARDLPAIWTGRGVSPRRAESALAEVLTLEPEGEEIAYTIDGDLYRNAGPLRVAIGPRLELVLPSSRA